MTHSVRLAFSLGRPAILLHRVCNTWISRSKQIDVIIFVIMPVVQAKVVQIGNSVGIVLTKEMQEKMNVSKGDTVTLVETQSGYSISAFDAEIAEEVALAREVSKQYRHMLSELAK